MELIQDHRRRTDHLCADVGLDRLRLGAKEEDVAGGRAGRIEQRQLPGQHRAECLPDFLGRFL